MIVDQERLVVDDDTYLVVAGDVRCSEECHEVGISGHRIEIK